VLELLVGCGGRDEEAVLVTGSQTADDASSGDCGVADRNDILEFGFEDTAPGQFLPSATIAPCCARPRPRPRAHFCIPVEVLRSTYCDNRIGVGECGEDTDSAQLVSTCSVCAFAPLCTYSLEFSNCARTAMLCCGLRYVLLASLRRVE
jgi:hypothetical protein